MSMDSSMRKFQSPPSVRKATALAIINAQKIDKFQSPPSVRKATCITNLICNQIVISIPAFREEGDWNLCHFKHTFNISIPAFREEGDGVKLSYSISAMGFSIPAFREEGDCDNMETVTGDIISIPAFREEGDR